MNSILKVTTQLFLRASLGAALIITLDTNAAQSSEAAIVLVSANPASVSHRKNHIDARQANLVKRIQAGIQSKVLTADERDRLRHMRKRLNKMERQAFKDGKISAKEMLRIQRTLNRTSRTIKRLKDNDKKVTEAAQNDAKLMNDSSSPKKLEGLAMVRDRAQAQKKRALMEEQGNEVSASQQSEISPYQTSVAEVRPSMGSR